MVDMRCRVRAHEEAVVVYIITASVNVCEKRDVLLLAILFHVEEISRHYVEVCGVEMDQVVKFLCADSKVSELLSEYQFYVQ